MSSDKSLRTIELAGLYITGATEEEEKILRGRYAFAEKYCKEKGWEMGSITFPQALEIRAQEGWKNPK